jgi:hypothetical protein
VQFQETWAVPPSTQALHVRDVRTVTGALSSADTSGGGTTSVQETNVVGLIADLGARPLKGPGFAAGRVAMADASGMLQTVVGSASDCVRVDGSSGPCGGGTLSFMDGDSPSGLVDGSNAAFGLSAVPDPVGSLAVYRNGMLQKAGLDYTLTGSTVQFLTGAVPQPGDTLLASYRTSGSDSGTAVTYTGPQVLCSGSGSATSSTALATVGSCSIPAGLLAPGDRVEIRFDYGHTGGAGGFSTEVHWGATTLSHRDPGPTDTMVTGRADASILASGAQLSAQTWGAALPLAATVASAADDYSGGITVTFLAMVVQASDSAVLNNFTVVRLP